MFLQAYQLILWKQCFALIHNINYPPQIESTVKEFWSLRLSLLSDKIDAHDIPTDSILSSQQAQTQEAKPQRKKQAKWESKYLPTLIETLALLYLSAIHIRLPVRIGDLHRYAIREDIPFIRAIRLVPEPITKGMPPEYMMALDTTAPLAPDHLRKAVHNLCLLYRHHFATQFAPLNSPLISFKYVRDLALPLNVFHATREIAELVGIEFSFPGLKGRQRISYLPEVALLCLIVIAVKLYHPFDPHPRFAVSSEDPASLAMDWEAWFKARQDHGTRLTKEGRLPRGSEINMTEDDVPAMTGEQMDDYLDWFERTWVDDTRAEHKPRGVPNDLLTMFPTGRADGSDPEPYRYGEERDKEEDSKDRRIRETMSQLAVRRILPEKEADSKPVGAMYKRYRSEEELTEHARAFHEEVAEVAAIELKSLLSAILQVENKILAWRREQLQNEEGGDRGDKGEEEDIMGSGSGDERGDADVQMLDDV